MARSAELQLPVCDEREREAVEIRFQKRMVQDIIINPPSHPGARSVPITAAHFQTSSIR